MNEASARAKVHPPVNFHATRHTYCTLALTGGVDAMIIAKNVGQRDTRMIERHYGHIIDRVRADAIRRGVPNFGLKPDRIVAIR
jgi:integrase